MSPFPGSLPDRLRRDGWWLTTAMAETGPGPTPAPRAAGPAVWTGAALLVATDFLVWGHHPGLGVILAGTLCLVAASVHACATRDQNTRAAAAFLIGALPMIEASGPIPAMFLILGTGSALVFLTAHISTPRDHAHNLKRLATRTPFRFLQSAARLSRSRLGRVAFGPILSGWLAALTMGAVFAALFAMANPIIGTMIGAILSADWASVLSLPRLLFWSTAAVTIGTLLHHRGKPAARPASRRARPAPRWLAAPAITNALILFNVLFAAQTLLDLTYLWGGITLPDDMTYAEYAHSGAYPLMATAILAGGFMLAATAFGPPTALNRKLLGLWIAQNLLLLASSVLRLDLYVGTYQLTYLRLAAFIWMALVAAGLGLMAWRIWCGHTNHWLLTRCAALTLATLYACCFVNFAHVIASHNVRNAQELSGTGQPLDLVYFSTLGPQAQYAADIFAAHPNGNVIPGFGTPSQPGWRYSETALAPNWRAWGFRDHRLARYLAATQPPEVTRAQDPHR